MFSKTKKILLAAVLSISFSTAVSAQILNIGPQPLGITIGQIPGSATNDTANVGNVGQIVTGTTNNQTATVTITIAAPGVVSWTAHGLGLGSAVVFTTTGALPTGLTAGTTYWVIPVNANSFQVASSIANAVAGTAITTSGTQSGVQTGTSNIALTTATATDIAFVSLTAGTWDVEAVTGFVPAGITAITSLIGWSSTTSATLPTAPNNGGEFRSNLIGGVPGNVTLDYPTGTQRLNLSATTTAYCSERASFSISTMVGFCFIRATRVR